MARVEATIARHAMVTRGDRVLVACSGGPDSLVLLHALRALAPRRGFLLRAVYVDHGLRAAAVGEGAKVLRDAAALGVSAEVISVQLRSRSMEAARDARYAALEALVARRGATKLAIAHTASDQAETVLMRLLRGAGVHGLAGIPPIRGVVIRPLLEVARSDVLSYCRARGLRPVQDPTNRHDDYLRNRVRRRLLPLLRRENPRIEAALCRLAENLRDVDQALEQGAAAIDGASVAALQRAAPALRARALERAHQEALARLVAQGSGAGRVDLPGGIAATRRYDVLHFEHGDQIIRAPGVYRFGALQIAIEEVGEAEGPFCFDPAGVPWPWRLRGPRAGDRMRPRGLGGSKKLQDLFVDAKIPRERRSTLPILLAGGEILCVGGVRASEIGAPTAVAGPFLRVTVLEAREATGACGHP
jgi:tRNA(Ile)-lysidine synthase